MEQRSWDIKQYAERTTVQYGTEKRTDSVCSSFMVFMVLHHCVCDNNAPEDHNNENNLSSETTATHQNILSYNLYDIEFEELLDV